MAEAAARQHAEALACFEHAIELETDNLQAWVGKGVCLGNLGEMEKALACYDRATELAPTASFGWVNNCLLYTSRCV